MSKEEVKVKKYILTIKYDEDDDTVEYLQEEIITSDSSFFYGEIDLSDYWDEDTIELLKDVYILGES